LPFPFSAVSPVFDAALWHRSRLPRGIVPALAWEFFAFQVNTVLSLLNLLVGQSDFMTTKLP